MVGSSGGVPTRDRAFWIGLALVVLWAVVSRLALDAQTYFDAEDALGYSTVVRARDFARFDAAGSGWQLLCTLVDSLLPNRAEAAVAGKLVARVAGSLLLIVLYATLAAVTRRFALSAATTLFFSVAFCPWWYSLQPDKYVPQLAVIAVALALVATRRRPPSIRFLVTLGVVYALAVVVHTDSGLVCLSILPLLLLSMRAGGPAVALGQGVLCAGVMAALLAAYYAVFLVVFIRPPDAAAGLHWIASYLGDRSAGGWGYWSRGSPLLAVLGIARTVVTTEFLFAHPELARRATEWFPSKILLEEQWLGAQLPPWLVTAGPYLLACAVLAVCAVLVFGVVAVRGLGSRGCGDARHAVASVACWLVPAVVFFTWWEPTNNEFWIAPWYGVVLVLGVVLAAREGRAATAAMAVGAVLLGLCNGLLGVIPRLDARSDYWLVQQGPLAGLAHADDLVVDYGYLAVDYMQYLTPARVFPTHWRGDTETDIARSLLQELEEHPATRSVYVMDLVSHAASNPSGSPKAREAAERFFRGLPPPAEWITVEGRAVARHDAPVLRAILAAGLRGDAGD